MTHIYLNETGTIWMQMQWNHVACYHITRHYNLLMTNMCWGQTGKPVLPLPLEQ